MLAASTACRSSSPESRARRRTWPRWRRSAAPEETPVQTWVGDSTQLGLLLGLIRNSRLYLGADTGPMHFAGALGVPVVACFGGGHWPRFLPLAQRSFVATQKLPCFGCGWLCWLDEPMCISRVSVQPFKDALDWILSGSPDERRVDTGEALGATAEAVLERARVSKRSAVDRAEPEARRARRGSPAGDRQHPGRSARPSGSDRLARATAPGAGAPPAPTTRQDRAQAPGMAESCLRTFRS